MLALTLLLACASYDVETWSSPLASGFDGVADPEIGLDLFTSEYWSEDAPYPFTCNSCHSAEPGDSLTVDDRTYNGAGHTVWNVAWRGTWKATHDWDGDPDDNVIGAYGGQVCVRAYYPDDAEMNAEQAAHLEAYLRERRDAAPEADDPRAEPLDFSFTTWETQDAFLAELGEDPPRGADLGDVDNGQVLAGRHCGACHTPSDSYRPEFPTAANFTVAQLVSRIRKESVAGAVAVNVYMPRLPADRLSDAELRDILAYLTADVED
ncbi:MAG: cytochrome c [Alphaproteobacteria bacterium]|nr:cytochrome c [Alphaproteobacteria bacterium]